MDIPTHRLEPFLRMLGEQVSRPSEDYPTVRVWSASRLRSLLSQVRQENRAKLLSTFPRPQEIIPHLLSIGWLHEIAVVPAKEKPTFYLMDMEASGEPSIDPVELLQAARPKGVVSYLGALSVYELTTQVPAFYHIGRLSDEVPPEIEPETGPPSGRNPLGSELFRYGSVSCLETRRSRKLTPGVQLRVVGPRTWLRITTLEQTLLDTLLQPQRCGGEAIALEAWRHAHERCDWDRMASHLETIARDSLSRRVGAMLQVQGIRSNETRLSAHLEKVRARVGATTPSLPLLPGLSFPAWDAIWSIRIP